MPLGTWWGQPRYLTLRLPGKAGLTASQLQDWFAYGEIEPFGEYREELRHGSMMAFHHNMNRDEKQRSEPFCAADFMNFINVEPERDLTPEEIERHFDRIFG